MTVEELLRQRSTYKALVTKSSCMLSHLISEGDVNRIQKHGVMMKAWFHSFDEASESYLETLTDDTDISAAESYYDAIYDDYMDQLDSLNYAMDSLTMQAPAVVQRTDSNPTLSTMSHIINLAPMVCEQENKPPIHPVKLDVQDNETVLPMSSHQCIGQLTPNSGLSLPVLQSNVETQAQVSVVTVTKEELPDLVDCGTPVINQSPPILLDTHIHQTDLHVPSPTPCAHYSHTAHVTMHPDRNVPSRRLFQLANSRCTNLYLLTVPPQHQLEFKETYIHSRTPRPGRKVKDGTLHIISTPRLAVCHILSGVT